MKQVININFQGRVVPIEVSAYEVLKNYIESLSRHFAGEEGKDEIINDIESRIGELFQERIKAGSTCITDDDVNAIIRSMGRPEDFETEEQSFASNSDNQSTSSDQSRPSYQTVQGAKRLYRDENHKMIGGVCSGLANYFGIDIVIARVIFLVLLFSGVGLLAYIILWIAVPSSASTEIGSVRKKMYRDTEEKYLGGVCSGIGHYFGINAWIPRVLFLLPFLSLIGNWGDWGHWHGDFSNFFRLSFSPGSLFIYIILWMVLPEANTTAEKLEMKGEKVDMNSIKNSVAAEMKGVHDRALKFGKEAAGVAGERGKTFSAEAGMAARRGSRSLGDIIIFIIKLFGYIILGFVALTLIMALFGFGIAAIGLFPLKSFLLTEGWQNALAWGTLLFFIIAPMIGVITWIIRKLTKVKKGSKMLGFSFTAMWILGWVCITFLLSSVSKDFRASSNMNEQELNLVNPGVNSMELTSVKPGQRFSRNTWFTMDPFETTGDDTAFVRNVEIHIAKSTTDSFKVTVMKFASGRTKRYADTLASLIEFNPVQNDSTLIIDKGIAINKTDKFRNQRVILTVYVPIGKQIKVNKNVGWHDNVKFGGPWSEDWNNVEFENNETGWDEGEWYTMTKDGLYTADGKPANSFKSEEFRLDEDGMNFEGERNRVRIDKDGIIIENNNGNGSYRYDTVTPQSKFDTLKNNLRIEEKRYRDSLKREKDKIEKQLEKLGKSDGGTASLQGVLPAQDPLIFLN